MTAGFNAWSQLVGRELEGLRSVETVNWSALGGQLATFEADSARWPMTSLQPVDDEPASDAGDADTDADDDGWWSGLRRSMGSLVRVSPRESAPLTPAAAESVRERLRLHLAAAQAAAARRNGDELASHASTAAGLIEAHFRYRLQRGLERARDAFESGVVGFAAIVARPG